jgi:hypothetical protein
MLASRRKKCLRKRRYCKNNWAAFKNKPLTDEQKQAIGFEKAGGITGLINLTYNMFRHEQIIRRQLLPIKK